MKTIRIPYLSALALAGALAFLTTIACAADPLPSWNDGKAKQSIFTFVGRVTKEGSPDFVPVPERIATFDNDGCLWAEQPMYFQAFFVFDRIKALAPQHPAPRRVTRALFGCCRDKALAPTARSATITLVSRVGPG